MDANAEDPFGALFSTYVPRDVFAFQPALVSTLATHSHYAGVLEVCTPRQFLPCLAGFLTASRRFGSSVRNHTELLEPLRSRHEMVVTLRC